ncbi:hypothetical protein BS50DRAFT_361863 [Corynespora cassiicola Philippines]|uniref:Uncharacterized protein n=1 Tax=Corynespora cassiicola Philippines TaxID=1448308 RepID=A0A2T2NSE0_CORCC|nr:hypothetical protein BS50DRAFT_361863 [Corynespora cassiicola Philippines]
MARRLTTIDSRSDIKRFQVRSLAWSFFLHYFYSWERLVTEPDASGCTHCAVHLSILLTLFFLAKFYLILRFLGYHTLSLNNYYIYVYVQIFAMVGK